MNLTIKVSPAELVDKLTILEIKLKKLKDEKKQARVHDQVQELRGYYYQNIGSSQQVEKLKTRLKKINKELWEAEDKIRICEREKNFGPRFIKLARSIYQKNGLRAATKQKINCVLSSEIEDEKIYESY